MDEGLERFRKLSKAVAAAGKAVEAAQKALTHSPISALAVLEKAGKAARLLEAVVGMDAATAALSGELSARADAAEAELDRERAVMAGRVATLLQAHGLRVEGNLPLLRAGGFTLELTFGTRGQCVVWLGTKKIRLAACGLDAEVIAARVAELDVELFGGEFDEAAFLADLERAYRVALLRTARAAGERVPITLLLAEVAFLHQDATFLADPRRELFRTYGRLELATRLARLRSRRLGPLELRLEVATMAQTRRSEDYLWVPQGRSVEGTNYSTACFVRAG